MRASTGEQLPARVVKKLLMGAEVTDFRENIHIIIAILHFTHNGIVVKFFFFFYCLFSTFFLDLGALLELALICVNKQRFMKRCLLV